MNKLRKWAKQLLRDNHDSLLIEAAKEVGIDVYKVITEEELKKITGNSSDFNRVLGRKDRDSA